MNTGGAWKNASRQVFRMHDSELSFDDPGVCGSHQCLAITARAG
jgi:hypothetical protein